MDALNLIVSSGVSATMLGVVVFWLKRYIKEVDDKMNKLENSDKENKKDIKENRDVIDNRLAKIMGDFQDGVNGIRDAVNEMRELVAVVKTQHGEQISAMKDRLNDHEDWLEQTDKIIDMHGNRITAVETKCKMKYE